MASSPQHEPTMEEILASIRKIISEDSPEAQAAAPAAAEAPAPVAAPEPEEAEVLELTQEVHEEPEPAPVAPEPVAAKPADDVVFEPVKEAPVSAPAPSDDSIFSDKTRKAVEDTFANIDVPEEKPAAKPVAAPSFAPVDGNSVEAVFERAVREAVGPHVDRWMDGNKEELLTSLRPLIREWMDDHFPALLEGAVRDEVARAVKARGR